MDGMEDLLLATIQSAWLPSQDADVASANGKKVAPVGP